MLSELFASRQTPKFEQYLISSDRALPLPGCDIVLEGWSWQSRRPFERRAGSTPRLAWSAARGGSAQRTCPIANGRPRSQQHDRADQPVVKRLASRHSGLDDKAQARQRSGEKKAGQPPSGRSRDGQGFSIQIGPIEAEEAHAQCRLHL